MNTVLNSYGQLYGCPEILKKSCKFFCRGLDIRVANIMHTNLLYARLLRPLLHFVIEIGFCDREQTLVWLNVIQHFDIFLHFLTEKGWHFDCTVTLFRFRTCDNIPSFRAVKCLADCDRLLLKIKISRSKRQQFAGADSAPVKHFKGIIGTWLIHHGFGEFQIFLFRPEIHFFRNLISHCSCPSCRIVGQIIEVYRMVENRCQLGVYGFQIIR